jgi:uncharacterized membrane protein
MSDLQIHINRAGQQYGPYPEATAREMLAAGQLLPTDLAWHPGAEGWKTLQELLGAEAAQASPTPPPPSNPAGPPKRQVAGGQPAEEKKEEPKEGEEADDPDKIHVTRKGEPIGPYPRDKAREYFIEGTLLPTDWAWHDGMGEDWKPLNEVLELPLPAGAGSGGSVSGGPWTIGGCLSEGWQKFKANLGPVILFFIISSLVLFITAVIPLVNFFVLVPVMAGYLFYFIKFSRGEPVAIGDLFSGFKRGYPQLLLVALLIGVIGFVAVLPGISVMIFSGAAFITDLMGTIQGGIAGNITDFGSELEGIFSSLKSAGVGLLAGVILMILLPPIALSFTSFSMPLVIDRQMKAVDAIIASARLMKGQWFKVVFFLILTGLISGFGQIVIIGGLITGPLAMTAWAIFYLKNAGSITAEHTAPVAKNMKIGLICGAVLPVGAAVAAVVMAGGSIMGVAGAIDSNGTSEDAGNSGGAQTVDMAKEVPGVYLIGAPQGGPNGLPIPMVITFKEGGNATINLEALKGGPGTGFKWEVDPDEDNTIKYLDAAGQEKKSRLVPGKGLTGDDGLSLKEETLTGSYSFNSGTTPGRLVLKKNHKAELRTGGPNPINLGWYVIGGFKQSPHEIWVTGGSIQLILSLDMDAKPYSMKLVARLQPNQASGKIDRLPIPVDRQITYTRAKGGGGQGGGQGGGNESPEPEE